MDGKKTEMKKSEIREPLYYAEAAVETMMRKFQAEDLPPKGHFHYHQGVFLSGVYKIWQLNGEERYFQYMKDWVDSCITADGAVKDYDEGQLDDLQPGILLYPLYERTGEEKYRKVLDRIAEVLRAFPRNGEGGFWHKTCFPEQMWLDGLYMGGPIAAEYGVRFGDAGFFDLVAEQALMMEAKTRDAKTELWYHAWDYGKSQDWADGDTGRAPEFWGRSIGWVPVAVLDDLDFFPENHPKRGELERLVKELLIAVCRYQSEDGRWYQVVDKGYRPDDWLENSCSCLFAAALAKAVRVGLLPESFLENARRGYEGVIRSLEWDGEDLLLGQVCIGTGVGDYAHYVNRPVSVNDLHGMGAFLIMCAEMAGVPCMPHQ